MLVSLSAAPAELDVIGGKALGLRRLVDAGLPVPPTLVLTTFAQRAARQGGAPGTLSGELARALAELGGPVIARSSASCEDDGAAPGIFRSVRGVRDAADLRDAVREVWASLSDPLARAALAATHKLRGSGDAAMAVVLQPERSGRRGTVYTRAPGAPEALLCEEDEAFRLVPRAEAAADPLARLALAAEAALGAPAEGADVEWVTAPDGSIELVQARRIGATPAAATWPPEAELGFSRAEPARLWRWDATHDPAPLSPAQRGLVERVTQARLGRDELRVVGGYLYAARRPGHVDPAAPPLAAAWRAVEDALAPLVAPAAMPLDAALTAYLGVVARYAELGAAIGAARRALVGALAASGNATPAVTAAELIGGVGAVSAPRAAWGWDVAALPPDGGPATPPRFPEPPRTAPPTTLAAEVVEHLPAARHAALVAEHDDALFAAAQVGVRRALDARARALGVPVGDAAWLPLEELLGDALAPGAAARAAAARAAHAEASRQAPPLAILGGHAVQPPLGAERVRRGRGVGGRVRGPAVVVDHPDQVVPAGTIAVVATVWPGFAAQFREVSGLVCEHGGLLGHGVALCRELGVACVVGITGARAWATGADLWLDGPSGVVVRLPSAAPGSNPEQT